MVTWKKKKLGDVAEIRMCKRIFAEQTTPTGEIPFFKIGTFGKEPDVYISRSLYDEYRSKYSFPNKGDILLSAAGTLGRTVVYDGKPAYFQDSNIVWLEIDEEQICNEFLIHCYQVMVWASPEGSTISRLYNAIIRDTDILLPPLPEQHRIAAALSDTDALITALERLIAKKRAIKQGIMQELLTGKRRLPGFEGEWVEKKLESLVISAKSGGTPLTSVTSYYDGYIPFLSINDMTVQGKYLRYTSNKISQEGLDKSASWVVPVDSLIYSMYASVGFVSIVKIPLAISQAVLCLEVNGNNDTEFLYYLLSFIQPNVFKFVGEGTQKNLNAKAVRNFELFMPPTMTEQTAIAEILSDMDEEIDKLTARLKKLRNIKQGMMSELLTGRIRLVEQDATTTTEI